MLIAFLFVFSSLTALADGKEGDLVFRGSDLPVVNAFGQPQRCHRSEMGTLVGSSLTYQTILVEYSCDHATHDRQVLCSTYWKAPTQDVPANLKPAEFTGTTRVVTLVGETTPSETGSVSYPNVAYADLDKTATQFLHDKCLSQVRAQ